MKNLLVILFMLGAGAARADHDYKVAKDVGSSITPAVVTGSSVAGTAFISANIKRMDGLAFNNTASTVWIGTVTATQNGVVHTNISNGIPVLSSTSFSLGGIMSDALYFTCNLGTATCEMRVMEGRNQ